MSIDIQSIDYNKNSSPKAFEKSLRDTGFVTISNHPIPHDLIDNVYSEWEVFFSNNDKFKYLFDKNSQEGFFPFLTENAKDSTVKDLKEFYHIYPWGKLPHSIGSSTMILFDEILSLATELLGWIEQACPSEIRNNFSIPLKSMIHESTSNLFRIIHYPPIAESDDASALRAAAHEDINLITVLIAGSEPGLQAQDLNGEWHNISCDKNTIVVNSGDMLKIASNNYYQSTTHRVINPDNSLNVSRYSMPLFLHPRDEVVLNDEHTARTYLNQRLGEIGLK